MLRIISFIILFAIAWIISVAPTTADIKRIMVPIGENAERVIIKNTSIYEMIDENCINMSEDEKFQAAKNLLIEFQRLQYEKQTD